MEFDKNTGKPKKPVSQMTEEEKKAAREEALKIAAENINKGNKFVKIIEVDSEDYKGKIAIHRPTIDEQREIGIREAQYRLGFESLDVVTQNICLYLATFDVIIDSAPDWWKPAEMYDYNVLEYIWEEYANWRLTFRSFSKPKPAGDSKTDKPETPMVDSKKV